MTGTSAQKAGALHIHPVDPHLPAALRALAFSEQRMLYTLMIQCAWQTVQSFVQYDKQL